MDTACSRTGRQFEALAIERHCPIQKRVVGEIQQAREAAERRADAPMKLVGLRRRQASFVIANWIERVMPSLESVNVPSRSKNTASSDMSSEIACRQAAGCGEQVDPHGVPSRQ
jgi:hypothetical protein